MVEKIQLYIKSLNFNEKKNLSSKEIAYKNALASLVDNHTIMLKDKKGKEETITAKFILIAVGSRPSFPDDIPNVR